MNIKSGLPCPKLFKNWSSWSMLIHIRNKSGHWSHHLYSKPSSYIFIFFICLSSLTRVTADFYRSLTLTFFPDRDVCCNPLYFNVAFSPFTLAVISVRLTHWLITTLLLSRYYPSLYRREINLHLLRKFLTT